MIYICNGPCAVTLVLSSRSLWLILFLPWGIRRTRRNSKSNQTPTKEAFTRFLQTVRLCFWQWIPPPHTHTCPSQKYPGTDQWGHSPSWPNIIPFRSMSQIFISSHLILLGSTSALFIPTSQIRDPEICTAHPRAPRKVVAELKTHSQTSWTWVLWIS